MSLDHARMPPMGAFRVFEAAARLGSFTSAARELSVTQSAVSRQVLVLEQALGVRLFLRSGPRVVLTPAGRSLASTCKHVMESLSEAVTHLRGQQFHNGGKARQTLTVTMLPSLAAKWFTPRLPMLLSELPHLDLRISGTRDVLELRVGDVDCAIRYGRGKWPKVRADLLMNETVIAVAAPGLIKRHALRNVTDLKRVTLLRTDNPDSWAEWLLAAGAEVEQLSSYSTSGPLFTDDVSLIESCVRQVGVALVRSRLIEQELRSGTLKRILPTSLRSVYSYYVVVPELDCPLPAVNDLVSWLHAQATPLA